MPDVYQPEFPTEGGAGRAREPERPLSDIVKDIIGNVQEIFRSEIRLARAEMTEKAVSTGRAAAVLAAGAIAALYALAFLLVTIYNALSSAISPWLAALMIAVGLGLVSGAMIFAGMKRIRSVNPRPERTIQAAQETVATVKQEARWVKDRMR